ncbi:MAG TPA: hypothetical protein VN653_01585 [Anaerolineales bacterium]|nr:hypothetical protein [Anaerolineales bacterium]
MTKIKTRVDKASVTEFLDSISDDAQRTDAYTIVEMLRTATKAEPKMWRGTIVGFDSYHYVDEKGRKGDWLLVGMSPRKGTLTLYILGGWDHNAKLLAKLGKHSLGNGYLLHIKRLDDIDLPVLKRLLAESFKRAKRLAPAEARNRTQQSKR